MKIMITGAAGQVGRELCLALAKHELIALDRQALDLSQPQAIRQMVRQHAPQLIINAAAYTAVDLAESNQEAALKLNAQAPGILAEEACALGIPLIHYSTDYVFDGRKHAPWNEEDAPHPLGVYGQSKLAGEDAIRHSGCAHLILRTSWVYALHGKNFLLTMQRLLSERDHVGVVNDQIGAPTWAGSIAQATAMLIERWQSGCTQWGTYHFSCGGSTSWFGFAQAIARHLAEQGTLKAQLQPIASSDYPTPAQRPANSRLDCSKLKHDWQVELPEWQSALEQCWNSPR